MLHILASHRRCHRRSARIAAVALAAAAVVTTGCEKSGSGFSVLGHAASEFPAVTDPPKVILDDPGGEDRAPLRYQLSAGTAGPLVMTMNMQMKVKVGDDELPSVPLPGMRLRASLNVASVDEGKARIEFVYDGEPEILSQGGDANPLVMSQLRRSLAGLQGTRGYSVVSDRGYTLEGDIELGPNPDPQLSQMMSSMRQALNQMAAPLPEEPVGAGARWTVLQHMKMNGIELYQVGKYRLERRDGQRLELSVEMAQGAPKQEFTPPGVPAGVTAKIRRFESTGKGAMKVELTNPVPTSTLDMKNEMTMGIEGQGQKQEMSMAMTMGVQLGTE